MQPMDIENFIWLSRVTYMGYYGDLAGGAVSAVILTCNPNIVQTYAEARNLNVAADAGLKVRLLPNPADEGSLFGDTLRVVLDATSLETLSNSFEWSDTTIVAATTQCILVNAAQLPAIKHVDLRVEGNAAYRKYVGVFSTRRFRAGPVRRQFY